MAFVKEAIVDFHLKEIFSYSFSNLMKLAKVLKSIIENDIVG